MNIRNFVIIAHIDHGKSTLADRLLEITGTIPAREMRPQYLDQLELERERGITIKMAPVRMHWHPHRGITRTDTRNNADEGLLYSDITYKIRGAAFEVRKKLGLGHKEIVYQKAVAEEFSRAGLAFEPEKAIDVFYEGRKVGTYQPDFIVDGKIIVELKALPFIGETEEGQIWSYLKGSLYKLAFLINFGSKDLYIKRIVYDTARFPRESASVRRESAEVEYILNLIDTPGHSDFSYEVSRALAAVEGAVLLVDATQGIQAQTLANYEAAKRAGLTIIGAVNKIDIAAREQTEAAVRELSEFLRVPASLISLVSGKTGAGVPELLERVTAEIPPPQPRPVTQEIEVSRALIFDSLYDAHKGVIAFIRVVNGEFRGGDILNLIASGAEFKSKEVGYFLPKLTPSPSLSAGEIGYTATGIKDPHQLKIGDTVCGKPRNYADGTQKNAEKNSASSALSQRELACIPLPGYAEPKPVVFVSFYPEEAGEYDELKKSLEKLHLTDSAFSFEPDASEVLGRGFKCGFLGQLHFEIAAERLAREFGVATTHSFPSVAYRVWRPQKYADQTRNCAEKSSAGSAYRLRESAYEVVTNPKDFPSEYLEIEEPVTKVEILTPMKFLSAVLELKELFRFSDIATEPIGEKIMVRAKLPLSDLIRDLDDKIKSVSQGFASLSYEVVGWEKTDAAKMEILVAGQSIPGLTRILPRKDIEREARRTVEKLKELLPKQQFPQALQAVALGRVVARETIPALKKLLGYFGKTGGDRTRKMKLWKKQQRGKERLKERAETRRLTVPASVFKELLKR